MLHIIDSKEKRAAVALIVAHLAGTPLMQVEIKEYRKNRSTAQNRLYWMWLGLIAKHVGEDAEDLHDQLKVRFLGVEHKVINGIACIVPKSSTKLTTTEFTRKMIEPLEALGAEMNVALPKPDDYDVAMGTARAA